MVLKSSTHEAAESTGQDASPHLGDNSDHPAYFDEALQDAERLLKYAAEIGIDIDDDIRDHVLQARAASTAGWNKQTTANLLAALTELAKQLKPVTADSLKASAGNTRSTLLCYWWVAAALAILIVPISIASFVTTAISNTIAADIKSANDLAVKLQSQLGPPPAKTRVAAKTADAVTKPAPQLPTGINYADVITELQQYATAIRAIDARTRQLNWFVRSAVRDPFAQYRWNSKLAEKIQADKHVGQEEADQRAEEENEDQQDTLRSMFQLQVGIPNMPDALSTLTTTYQSIRSFGQDTLDMVSVSYGAITTCLLPALYALLGTCAYLLRTFEQQMSARTFTPSVAANSARFLIAAIGGAVVGLFNNFSITQGASIPPLAIAFLVGYAVDVFFSFLEGLLQAFTKGKASSPASVPAFHG